MARLFNIKAALFLTVLLAFFLRFYNVTHVPPSLNWDEVSIAYNSYSILNTGKDEWGQVFPLHFRAYGEYKLPMQIYASIPAIWLLGLNDLSVRITPVIYGTLTVLLCYFLAAEISKNKRIGLATALMIAISPWHIHLTRASFESSFSVFWVVLGAWLFVKSLKRPHFLLLSTISFVISVYTYNSARVFAPIFMTSLLFIYRKDLLAKRKQLLSSLLVFLVLLIPLISFTLSGQISSRYKLVSVTDDPGLVPRIDEARGMSKLPPLVTRLLHNRVTYISLYFAQNYISHFSPDFLFISGAPHKQHSVQNMGELYFWQAPFVLMGLYIIFRKKNKFRWLLISWLLISIIPVAVTRDSIPNALRTVIAVPVYSIFTAFGMIWFWEWLTKRNRTLKISISVLLSGLILGSLLFYLDNYFTIYPVLYSRDWQYGYKEVMDYVNKNYSKYDEIVISRTYGEPHMFALFYLKWNPADYQNNQNLVRYQSYDWVWVERFDKFYFPDLGDKGTTYSDIKNKEKGKKLLFVGKPGDFPSNLPRELEVYFLDGSKAFEAVESR